MIRRASRLVVTALLAVTVVGCASAANTGGGSGLHAADYADPTIGNSWSYRITPGPETLQTVTMVSRDERGFYVDDQGGRLAPRSDGLYDGVRFLLKEPIEAGAEWMALPKGRHPDQPGAPEHYRITATGLDVTVPAGTYRDCVEVEGTSGTRDPQSGKAATLVVTWTWAPHVGLVRMKQAVRFEGATDVVPTATMELVTFSGAPAAPAAP